MSDHVPLDSKQINEVIRYFIVLKDEQNFNWDPTDLEEGWIRYLSFLPRNLYQLFPSDRLTQILLNLFCRTSMNINTVRTSHLQEVFKFEAEVIKRQTKKSVAVICIEDEEALSDSGLLKLKTLFAKTLFISSKDEIRSKIASQREQLVCTPQTHLEIVIELSGFLTSEGIPCDFKSLGNPDDFITFSPAFANLVSECQLNHNFDITSAKEIKISETERASRHVLSAQKVEMIREKHQFINDDLLLIAPYASPSLSQWHKESLNSYIRANPNFKDRKIAKDYISYLSEEQDDLYRFYGSSNQFTSMSMALDQIAKHLKILDNMALLHSSHKMSPSIRLPFKGKSLNQELSFFDPLNFREVKNIAASEKKLNELGRKLFDSYPKEIMNFIFAKERQIIAISDLPVEWISDGEVPLGFLCDTCRLPENPARTLMTQHIFNTTFGFEISKDILKKTLVVCGAPHDHVISAGFKMIKELVDTEVEFFETSNLNQLKNKVRKFRPELLIFYSHGFANKDKFESELQIGTESLTNDFISKNSISAPLVVIIACEATPLYGYHNPIAQAFFEAGSISVTGPVLPIFATQGARFCAKILNQLSHAATNGIHRNWLGFLSHTCRSILFDEYFDIIARDKNLGATTVLKQDLLNSSKLPWLMNLLMGRRRECFLSIKKTVSNCFSESDIVLKKLNTSPHISESLFFTHWGRPDLVLFHEWNRRTLKRLHG